MSQRFERVTEVVEGHEETLDKLREVYHVPVLAALLAFMLWIRTHNWENFVPGDRVLFSGNDAWYHLRMVQYTVEHFPNTMPFDPWTNFPTGTSVGQFGTLFDQLVALAALVVGLGNPTDHQIALTLLFAPAVIGTLVAIPTYFIGKHLGGRGGGIIAVALLALSPGVFFQRSLVGFSDHHVAEALFMAISVAFLLQAFAVAGRDKPVFELVQSREFDPLRPTLLWSALGGLSMGLFVWVWPPAVFFFGLVGIALVLILSLQYVRGVSPDHLAIPAAVMLGIAGVVALVPITEFGFSATDFSLAQPFVAFAVAAGAVFMAVLARQFDERDLPRYYYPLTIVGIAAVGSLLVMLVAPNVFDFFTRQVMRVIGLGASSTALTVGEARPPSQPVAFLYNSYGLAFYTAIAGMALLAYRVLTSEEPRGDLAFVVVWFVFLVLMALTQLRFDYYLILAVAGLNGYFAARVFALVHLDDLADDLSNVEAYQILTVVTVFLLVIAPLAIGPYTVLSASNPNPGEVQNWESSLDWLGQNTPAQGAYGDGSPSDLEYLGTYERTDDFQYDEGEYGTLAWWDYGHWLTVMGHQVPDANPFQQGARHAADVLLADNETQANELMVSEDGEQTRYVVVDYQLGLAGTQKFTAPAAWETEYNLSTSDIQRTMYVSQNGRIQPLLGFHTQRSYESLRVRLYQFHGSRVDPQPIVTDYDVQTLSNGATVIVPPQDQQVIKQFPNMSAARAYVEQDGTSQVGGLLGNPSEPVPALKHYRLVHASNETAETPVSRLYPGQTIAQEQWVKVFERVPGATVEGTGPANTTVTARVGVQMDNGRVFFYRQQAHTDENGKFTMTLPYSTTGYDEWGTEEGYTNPSVRAVSPYQFYTPTTFNESAYAIRYQTNANVTEGQVIGEDGSPVTVDLERTVVHTPEGANQTDTGNGTTNGTDAAGNETATNGTDTQPTNSTNATANGTAAMRAPTLAMARP
jgi:oligosaccharyl transferase (archaeosortase A-associated)